MMGLLVAGLGVNALIVVYLVAAYPSLPPFLPLHYGSSGSPDLIGPREELYKLPAIGALVLGTNLVLASALYSRERLASYLLSIVGLSVQLALMVATTMIVGLAFGE